VIVAAGLTPAWQQIMRFDRFRAGEVNRAKDVHWCASGKVLNVAMALAHLGGPCETIALVGGPPREHIAHEFSSLGIRARWVEAHWSTRVCTTILDLEARSATELVENAGPVTAEELDEFRTVYAQAVAGAELAILTGSLPRGAPRTFFRELLAHTRCRAVLDIRGQELLEALACHPFLVKPNREELAGSLGRPLETDAQLKGALRELNERGATWAVVTHGAEPVWASSQNTFYRFESPAVEVVNPIGSGDCLAAGIGWGLARDMEPIEAIRLGIAAAAENVRQLLPSRLDPAHVLARKDSVFAEQI
jgi:tagatose 6-phosphate kinase